MYNLIKSKREAGILKTPKTITVLIILYVLGIVVRVTTPSGFPFRSASNKQPAVRAPAHIAGCQKE